MNDRLFLSQEREYSLHFGEEWVQRWLTPHGLSLYVDTFEFEPGSLATESLTSVINTSLFWPREEDPSEHAAGQLPGIDLQEFHNGELTREYRLVSFGFLLERAGPGEDWSLRRGSAAAHQALMLFASSHATDSQAPGDP